MADEDDNRTPRGRGEARGDPPVHAVARRRGYSPASDLTTLTTPTRRPRRGDIERVDEVLLADLPDNNISPVQRLTPLEEEDLLEARAYAECPGANDRRYVHLGTYLNGGAFDKINLIVNSIAE